MRTCSVVDVDVVEETWVKGAMGALGSKALAVLESGVQASSILFISFSRSTITITSSRSSTPFPPRPSSQCEHHPSSRPYAAYGRMLDDREGVDGRDISVHEPFTLADFHTTTSVTRCSVAAGVVIWRTVTLEMER